MLKNNNFTVTELYINYIYTTYIVICYRIIISKYVTVLVISIASEYSTLLQCTLPSMAACTHKSTYRRYLCTRKVCVYRVPTGEFDFLLDWLKFSYVFQIGIDTYHVKVGVLSKDPIWNQQSFYLYIPKDPFFFFDDGQFAVVLKNRNKFYTVFNFA